jgi:large subunit ribosomal protein L24
MKAHFSKTWKSSTQVRKQRKYRYNAPFHLRAEFLNVHLSKELIKKYGRRAIRVRKGDKVRILRGNAKKKEGNVERVDTKKSKVFVTKVETERKDGTKALRPLDPSNLMIIELGTEDKNRKKILERKK